MTRHGRRGAHRSKSKKNRITLAVAPVAALAMAASLMINANAATPDEVKADCNSNSDKLEKCEFVDVQANKDSFGPNELVSNISDNCGSDSNTTKSFTGTASSTKVHEEEDGFVTGFDTKLSGSIFQIGIKYTGKDWKITRDEKASSFSFTRSDTVRPDHIAFYMWSHKRVDVSGYVKAIYKEQQNGQKTFFSPSEGARTVHVFYPTVLNNGSPDGLLWLRSIKCGTPQADALLGKGGNSSRSEPGLKEAGANVTDVEVPLSKVATS